MGSLFAFRGLCQKISSRDDRYRWRVEHTLNGTYTSAKRLLGPCDMQTYTSVLLGSFCVPKSLAKDRWGKGGHSRTPTMCLRQFDQALGDVAKIPSPRLTSHQQHHAHHNTVNISQGTIADLHIQKSPSHQIPSMSCQ